MQVEANPSPLFDIIGFKIQYLSPLNAGATFTPLEIMDRSVSSPAIAGLEFLTGFTLGAIFSTIYMVACGARFPSEQVEPPRAEARGSSTCFVGRKLQEEPVTGQEVKENEIKFTKCLKRKGEEGQSRSSQLGSDCWVTQ